LSQQPDYQAEKVTLIGELNQAGIKYNPDKIVRIVKQADGKILFLEEGNTEARLQHILEHSEEFSHLGIEPDEIPDAVIAAVTQGKMLGYQGKKKTRAIYEVNFNGKTQYIAVTVKNNGYIVGANPRTAP
jgi:hypothetical protein